MNLSDLLSVDRVCCDLRMTSKKKALQATAELLSSADSRTAVQAITEGLFARERLGSTGLGQGVALPHTRLDSVQKATGALLILAEPVNFDAMDGQPVDLIFGLMVPEDSAEEHLDTLARLAELFSSSAVRARLRSDLTPAEALEVVTQRSAAATGAAGS